jgi:molybdenum cofactor cytidylyltransferase
VTSTTHLGSWQTAYADHTFMISGEHLPWPADFQPDPGVTLVTGRRDQDRLMGLAPAALSRLREFAQKMAAPLLVEADGAHQKPLKAPADHEPVIPEFCQIVIVVAGLSGLLQPLTGEVVHRPEVFQRLSGLRQGQAISPHALVQVLQHPCGGLKGIPAAARRIVLLNQADTMELQQMAGMMQSELLATYSSVVVASLKAAVVSQVYEKMAGIVLAAGSSSRLGQPKQLLDFHGAPFVRCVAQAALAAGLDPVLVVTGAHADRVEAAVHDLPVRTIHNPDWQQGGQSSSIRTGLERLGPLAGGAIFLLSDQPQVTTDILAALLECHARSLCPIAAPWVKGRRANPVLFDRSVFPQLGQISGDSGGRALFGRIPVTDLPWQDESLLLDVDTPEDYRWLLAHG